MSNSWVKRWKVNGSNSSIHTVAQRQDGSWGCSCPAWKFAHAPKPDCHHILTVKQNPNLRPDTPIPTRERVLAHVREVTPKGKNLLTPLIPVGDAWFAATVAYDLNRFGASPEDVKSYLYGNSLRKVIAYIQARGRRIYGPQKGLGGFVNFETVPVEEGTSCR